MICSNFGPLLPPFSETQVRRQLSSKGKGTFTTTVDLIPDRQAAPAEISCVVVFVLSSGVQTSSQQVINLLVKTYL